MGRVRRVGLLLTLIGLLGACSTITPSPSFRAIELGVNDGLTFAARVYDAGETAVILAHMSGTNRNQEDWAPLAERLSAAGYTVLTYNRAGVCDPDGVTCSDRRGGAQNAWRDVVSAVEHLREAGAAKVIAGGASAGAMAALRAAEEEPSIDGVIWFAGGLRGSGYDFNEDDIARIQAPLLLISATEDPLANARTGDLLADWATAPTEVLVVESDRHGTDVLAAGGPAAEKVMAEIERFVAGVAKGGSATP